MLTSEEQKTCFTLLDECARAHHNSFLAEFFFSAESARYYACFRPLGENVDDSNRYAFEYLQFTADELRMLASEQSIPSEIAIKLDAALARLGRS
jgi:hypothetical protein